MISNKLLVSVLIITYNHEKYIAQAIESVLMQKTNFDYEIVIGEDCSTDRTREIVLEYKAKQPDKIKLLLQEKNVGMMQNFIDTLKACNGKYIALLEGDDYWTDPYKLQKQVYFLEANPEYGLVYTDFEAVDENGNLIDWEPLPKVRQRYKSGFLFYDVLKGAMMGTLTCCFKKDLISELKVKKDIWYILDWWLWLRITMKSKAHCINEKTACYRRHPNNTINPITLKDFNHRKKLYYIVYDNIIYLHKNFKPQLSNEDKEIVFKSICRLLIRKYGSFRVKIKVIPLFFFYFPGFKSFAKIIKKVILNLTTEINVRTILWYANRYKHKYTTIWNKSGKNE